ncbi:hypothetical protein FNV43_RR07970 [Rhamnella rubrinervis]|uniref:Uncharacterized protein n=1 Tax=Rhamnella rubrinervis TaxID=2594499 RepID=A0A8K0HHL1_9ROSA|nr:hypothetical protein FNV43_RR07970 [Rhamnella rubrinervis]
MTIKVVSSSPEKMKEKLICKGVAVVGHALAANVGHALVENVGHPNAAAVAMLGAGHALHANVDHLHAGHVLQRMLATRDADRDHARRAGHASADVATPAV